MKSIAEDASKSAVLIDEISEKILQEGKDTYTLYRGITRRVAPGETVTSTALLQTPPDEMVSNTLVDSVGALVAKSLGEIPGVEAVFLEREEGGLFRVWTIIPDLDIALEDQIYSAQMALMDRLSGAPFDFLVLFRQGNALDSVRPAKANQVFPHR